METTVAFGGTGGGGLFGCANLCGFSARNGFGFEIVITLADNCVSMSRFCSSENALRFEVDSEIESTIDDRNCIFVSKSQPVIPLKWSVIGSCGALVAVLRCTGGVIAFASVATSMTRLSKKAVRSFTDLSVGSGEV